MMTHEELILKAKEAKSAEELLAVAKENNIELTKEDAELYMQMNGEDGPLSDDALDKVTGGAAYTLTGGYLIITVWNKCDKWRCNECGGSNLEYTLWANGTQWGWAHHCENSSNICEKSCDTCKYEEYRFPFLICTNPENRK